MRRSLAAISILAALAVFENSGAAQTLPPIVVSTLAGSGAAGFADGPARAATFLLPMGIAYDRKGDLIIADAAAQRIRVLHRNGRVTTLAGGGALDLRGLWVPGGYRDATGANARFNRPTGVAVDRDGTIYVADSDNHCIRRLDSQGRVTTFAGSPARSGRAGGPLAKSSFMEPLGLAFDRDGNLYVADPQTGLRKISRDGTVTTIAVGTTPLGVAVAATAPGPVIYVAGITGLGVKPPTGDVVVFPSSEQPRAAGQRFLQGYRTLGDTFGVAVLDPQTAVYTDPRTNTVRFLQTELTEPRIIGGQSLNDASGDTGAFTDGPSGASYFDDPTGIAIDNGGGIVVADSGSRRIRRLAPIARRPIVVASLALLPALNTKPDRYKIGFLGNSFIWQNAEWDDSIEAMMERQLETSRAPTSLRAMKLKPAVSPIAAGSLLNAAEQYLQTVNGTGRFYDAVVFDINTVTLSQSFDIPEDELAGRASEWSGKLTEQVRRIDLELKGSGIPLIIVTHPMPYQLSPTEGAWLALVRKSMEPDFRVGELLTAALNASGARVTNLWPAFVAAEAAANHPPLFMTEDPHFTVHGRAIVAKGAADALEQLHPWQRRSLPAAP